MNGAHTQLSPRLNGGDTVVGFTKQGMDGQRATASSSARMPMNR